MQTEHRAISGVKFLFVAVVLICGLTSYPYHEAQAATEPGWYLGFGAGQFRETGGTLIEEPDQSTGRKYFAGYDIYGFFSLEVVYFDLDGPLDELASPTDKQTYDIDGPAVRALLSIPLYQNARTRVSLFGSAGTFRWDVESKLVVGGTTTKGDARDTSPVIGGGIWIRSKNASTRIEFEMIDEIDDPIFTANQLDLRMWTISFIYHF